MGCAARPAATIKHRSGPGDRRTRGRQDARPVRSRRGPDFVGVFHLRAISPRHELLRLAAAKDPGCTPARFGEAIARLGDRRRADFAVDDERYAELRAEYADWLAELSA